MVQVFYKEILIPDNYFNHQKDIALSITSGCATTKLYLAVSPIGIQTPVTPYNLFTTNHFTL